MNIIYLYQYFKFPTSSGGTRAYDLATSLIKKGHTVEILTTSSFFQDEELKKGWNLIQREDLKIHVLRLNYSNDLSALQRMVVFFSFLILASIKILKIKGDVVLATSTPLTVGIPALIKKWFDTTPYIFEVRDVWPETVIAVGAIKNRLFQSLLYKLESLIYQNALAIVPLSKDMKSSIVTRYPMVKEKCHEIIENLAEINRFQNGYSESDLFLIENIGFKPRFTVLYAGTFGHVNGLDYIIKFAEKLKHIDSTICFVLLGNGAKKKEVIKEAEKREVLGRNIFILDAVPKKLLPQLYYESSMGSSFVINVEELWANSANKFFDTLAAGRPVLINHSGWQKDVIKKMNVGYVLPPTPDIEAAKLFAAYTHKESLHKEQNQNALKLAEKEYSLERAIEKYERVFAKVEKKCIQVV